MGNLHEETVLGGRASETLPGELPPQPWLPNYCRQGTHLKQVE